MTPIQFALMEIHHVIPKEVLDLVFIPMSRYRLTKTRNMTTTVDQMIIDKIIEGRIRQYIDAQGAQEVTIPLDGLRINVEGSQAWSCHIPKNMTQGRRITSVLGIHINYLAGPMGGNQGVFTQFGVGVANTSTQHFEQPDLYTRAAGMILNANRPVELNYTANVYLIDENTIYCEDRMPTSPLALRCKLASDSEFSFIQGGNIPIFAQLVLYATQAYIYREASIRIDKAPMEAGIEVGTLKEWVDKYSDAEENFQSFIREKWRKIQRMSDKVARINHLNRLVPHV